MASNSGPGLLNISKLLDNSDGSDVTVVFANRKVKCHKMILCAKSEYFKSVYSNPFKEQDQNTIELKEDDPTAVYALLEFLYTGEYNHRDDPHGKTWKFYLHVAIVADKYREPDLIKHACAKFFDLVHALGNTAEIAHVIVEVRKMDVTKKLKKIIDKLEMKHLSKLVEVPEYRQFMENDRALLWEKFTILSSRSGLVQMRVAHCTCGYRQISRMHEERFVDCLLCGEPYQWSECFVDADDEPRIMDDSQRKRRR